MLTRVLRKAQQGCAGGLEGCVWKGKADLQRLPAKALCADNQIAVACISLDIDIVMQLLS
jgi:hypothetical protein